MSNSYFKDYTRNLTRVLMAEFIDDMQSNPMTNSGSQASIVSLSAADIAHLLPPFPPLPSKLGQ
ncbi:MAG: hypothetical protein AAFO75_10305 [Pseudomonadota bacterium]